MMKALRAWFQTESESQDLMAQLHAIHAGAVLTWVWPERVALLAMVPVYSMTKLPMISRGISALGTRVGGGAGSILLHTAIACLDELHYLDELDEHVFGGDWNSGQWNVKTEELAFAWAANRGHMRWAAVTAFTCIDVCAAVIARILSIRRRNGKEASFSTLTRRDVRPTILAPWKEWVDVVAADARYVRLCEARHPLVHAGQAESGGVQGQPRGHAQRSRFRFVAIDAPRAGLGLDPAFPEVRPRVVIEESRACATEAFERLLALA